MKRNLSRRRLLQGAGVSIALPPLSCLPEARGAADTEATTRRMLLISNNLGVLPDGFFPAAAVRDDVSSPYLKELEEFRHDFTVFSGLSHPGVIGGHSTENCFLTAARGPTRSGFRNQISLDQYAAEMLGQQTRFPTLNLGVNIDRANRSLSWTRDGALLPAEVSPATLFGRMFFQGSRQAIEARLHDLRLRGSILDTVLDDTQTLRHKVGPDDRARLDQYLTSVRELEERLAVAGWWETRPVPQPLMETPVDIEDKSRFFEKFSLWLSLAKIAFETDSTRIITLMLDAYATPAFHIDETEKSSNGYHNLSHHGHVAEKLSQLETVDRKQMRMLNRLFRELAAVPDGDARLLDRTMILYGSNMGDANTHDNTNLPILLAGGGFRHGQHLVFDADNNTPLSNLFVSMLQRFGVETDSFGTSTGSLAGLE